MPWWSDDDGPYLHRTFAARCTWTGYSLSINNISEMSSKYIERRGTSHFILTSFQAAISETSLHKKWLHADVLHEYIHQRYCSDGLRFSQASMMRCINKTYQNSSYNANYIEDSNGTKLDVYIQNQRLQGETKRSYYFYITKTGAAVPALPTAGNSSAWEADILAVNRLLPPATRQRPELVNLVISSTSNHHHHNNSRKQRTASPSSSACHGSQSSSISTAAKRTRRHGRSLNGGSSIAPSSSDDTTSSPDDAILASSEERKEKASEECITSEVLTTIPRSQDDASSLESRPPPPPLETYWDSPEAKLLFRPLASESTVLAAIDNQIKALRHVNKSSNAFLSVAVNLDDELNEDDVTEHQKWAEQQKAQYLALALQLARENMNAWTWQKCCEQTIGELQRQGLTLATRHETVSKWYRSFRETRRFVIPQPKKNLPPFLHQNPDICTKIKEYGRTNLDTLSIEMLSDFIHDKV